MFYSMTRALYQLLKNFSALSFRSHSSGKPLTMGEKPKELIENIVWVDLEMTGLDIEKDHILEIACIITDSKLNIVAEGPNIIIHQPDDILNNMNEWCTLQHGETGLTEKSRQSKIDVKKAELDILKFIKPFTIKSRNPLAGNSIYMDRIFLQKYMPEFNNYLNYRNVDVSTVKELSRRWYPNVYNKMPTKKLAHRALSDIHESIRELQYYQLNMFK